MAFWDNIRFPYFNMQELNLDWIMRELKRIAGFMPQDGNVGDILTRKSDGAAWEPPEAVNINIDGLPQDTQIMDNDQLIFYDISAQANRKIKPPDLMDSMCSNGTPLMNGTGAAGTSKKPARYDHVHPTDTSRAPANYFQNGALMVSHGGTGANNREGAFNNLITIISKTFTVDCADVASGTNMYCGQYTLTDEDKEGAKIVIPEYARKTGYNFPLTIDYENGNIRLLSPSSLTGVTVGIILIK